MHSLDDILKDNTTLDENEAKLRHAMRCSPFIQRLLLSDAALLPDLLQHLHTPWTRDAIQGYLSEQAIHDEPSLKSALRGLRKLVMLRTITRDLNGLADLSEVMQVVTALAEVTVQLALTHLTKWQEAIEGVPVGESGKRQELTVVGMGKLGGGELNVSSDIDLIFAYEEDGKVQGKDVSNYEFFAKLSKKLIAAIDEATEDGFVFRVDMCLRPYGSEGPIACSFAMLEEYYQNQGREWERYAWIKGRVIAGPEKNLDNMLRPFIFRKYLDFGAIASMRDLKVQIERDVSQRSKQGDIKLGRGGIREVEFIVQVFQLIRGGRDRRFQIRSTMQMLQLLKKEALLPESAVQELSDAYVFLRNLEHRLQYVEDAQTQELPTTEATKARIALAMGYPKWAALGTDLEQHRNHVAHHFSEVFSDSQEESPENDEVSGIWRDEIAESNAIEILESLGYREVPEVLRRLQSLSASARYKQLPAPSRQRFDVLMPLVIKHAASAHHPEITLMRVSDLLDSICRRASYLALLAEYPAALNMLIHLAGASPWLMQYLTQHPILLDELLDTGSLYAAPDFAAMQADLRRRLLEVADDVERQMDIMRDFKHAATFRFAAQDIAGSLPLETLSDYLSALADLVLETTIEVVWQDLRGKHLDAPKFAVIGYGKLGGKELGYASDLDIIFLYDDEAEGAGEVYARLGQRINNWLSSLTSAGTLYETDLRLRPDGASGLLVSSVDAFRTYQLEKAWIWEHQALTRARFCAGDTRIGKIFEKVRSEVLQQPRDTQKLQEEVVTMRQKMHSGHPNTSNLFDLKHDSGGIVDVEFIVQYLILAHAGQQPKLTQNIGNIALLGMLAKLGLLEKQKAENVATAYREYRRLQHAIRLQGESKARVALEGVESQVAAVRDLWDEVFGKS